MLTDEQKTEKAQKRKEQGEAIRRCRKHLEEPPSVFAARFRVNEKRLENWERGHVEAPLEVLVFIAKEGFWRLLPEDVGSMGEAQLGELRARLARYGQCHDRLQIAFEEAQACWKSVVELVAD